VLGRGEGDRVLTHDQALSLLQAAREESTTLGVPMSFAVMDPAGHLVALVRMDGAPWISADVAQGKAWTAAAYGAPSAAQKAKMEPMPNFASAVTAMTHGRFTPQTGAVPVYSDGQLLGALGGSGGTGQQDEDVCAAAVAACGFSVS
jgi:uncharacterized protein GlcG (DUF336 family)